jgi:hypothetical protein
MAVAEFCAFSSCAPAFRASNPDAVNTIAFGVIGISL